MSPARGLDELALLQIVAGDDEVGGFHGFDPGIFPARIRSFADDRLATVILFETSFALAAPPITPSRFLIAR